MTAWCWLTARLWLPKPRGRLQASARWPPPAEVAPAGAWLPTDLSSALAHCPVSSLDPFLLLLIRVYCKCPSAWNLSLLSPDGPSALFSLTCSTLHLSLDPSVPARGREPLLTSFFLLTPTSAQLKCFLPPSSAVMEKVSSCILGWVTKRQPESQQPRFNQTFKGNSSPELPQLNPAWSIEERPWPIWTTKNTYNWEKSGAHIDKDVHVGEASWENSSAKIISLVCGPSFARTLLPAFLFRTGKLAPPHLTTQRWQLTNHVPIRLEHLKDAGSPADLYVSEVSVHHYLVNSKCSLTWMQWHA